MFICKRMWLVLRVLKVYVPIISWMFRGPQTPHIWVLLSLLSLHFPHVQPSTKIHALRSPGWGYGYCRYCHLSRRLGPFARSRERWEYKRHFWRDDCQSNTHVHFGQLMNIGWNWTETLNYNVSSYFLWGRRFLHLLWTHLHNSPLNYGFCVKPRSLCKHVASKKFKVESRSRFTKAKVRKVGRVVSSISIW